MNLRQLLRETTAAFRAVGIPDPEVDSAALLSFITGRAPLSLRLDIDTVLSEDVLSAYQELCDKRMHRHPLQYLTHEQSFLGRSFYVDERVLIPRPETELLAERVVEALHPLSCPTVLDLCCGSGCIGISVALEAPHAAVHVADLSEGALSVTQRNADALGAAITLHQGDLFSAVEGMTFDLIVSNPPYIPAAECLTLQEEVLYEPNMALDGGKDGYDFYRRIAWQAPAYLKADGMVFLEVGWDQGESVRQLMMEAGFRHVCIHPDLQGIPRMVEAHL